MSGRNWTWLAAPALAAVLLLAVSVDSQEAPRPREGRQGMGMGLAPIAVPPAFLETLSAEQREKITALQQKERAQLLAVREATLKEIGAALTPGQRAEFERLQAEARERAAQRMREVRERQGGAEGERPRRQAQ